MKVDPRLGGTGGNPIIKVSSQAELMEQMNWYKQLGQRFRIIREIDPPTTEKIVQLAKEQGIVIPGETGTAAMPENSSKPIDQQPVFMQEQVQTQRETRPVQPEQTYAVYAKPKIVTIGDIQLKYDGNKIYRKQWISLTPSETSNFRIVSDSNNKVVSLAGRHIEAKRWVLVEDAQEDSASDDSVERILANE